MLSFWHELVVKWPYVLLFLSIILFGLWLSNFAYDRGVPQYISRKIGHTAGGICFLLAPFVFQDLWIPFALAGTFSITLFSARFLRPTTFRGVGGSGRSTDSYAEVVFAAVAIPVYLVGWLWLKEPLYAAAALLFMAWGDAVTGLVRAKIYNKPVKGVWGSLGMLLVCLGISWIMIKPFWLGVASSMAAVAAEFSFGDVGYVKRIDDNFAIPVISLAVLVALTGI